MAFTSFHDPPSLPDSLAGSAVAIGNFDGVHRGHLAVIEAAEALAKGRPAIALTFEPHPRMLFRPDEPMFRLTPLPMKERLLRRAGLAAVVTMTFDRAFASMSAEAFLEDLLVGRLKAHGVAVGYDFHFGKDRQGTTEFLLRHGRALGLDIAVVAPMTEDGAPVSSSAVRAALMAGDLERANLLLGHEWSVLAEVIHGDKRGREFGYPTANMRLEPDCGLRHGIYAVRATIDGVVRSGVASFGRRPMFDAGGALLETHVFDFDGDLYGKTLEIAFVSWIRAEARFDSVEALIAQMDEDSRIARGVT